MHVLKIVKKIHGNKNVEFNNASFWKELKKF